MSTLLRRLPFMGAFFIALAAMPRDTYTINSRGIGTVTLSPWERRLGRVIRGVTNLWSRLLRALRSPGAWRAASSRACACCASGRRA